MLDMKRMVEILIEENRRGRPKTNGKEHERGGELRKEWQSDTDFTYHPAAKLLKPTRSEFYIAVYSTLHEAKLLCLGTD